VILTLLNYSVNREGDFMTFEQIVTYIIAPLIAGGAAVWGLVRWVIPKLVDAKITEQKDVREHRQKMDALQTEYLKAEAETTYQMMGSLLENSQAKEDKANDFFRTLFFNAVDQIKTNAAQVPEIKRDIGELKHQFADFATKLSLLIDIFQDDYNRRKSDEPQPKLDSNGSETGGNGE
jgi:hypothetical protein